MRLKSSGAPIALAAVIALAALRPVPLGAANKVIQPSLVEFLR